MTQEQQELYDKLLKKVNEYCLGQAAEDVIAAIDALVDTYETKVAVDNWLLEGVEYYIEDKHFTASTLVKSLRALDIIKEKNLCWDISYQPYEEDNDYRAWDNELYQSIKLAKEEYELLKEIL